MILKEQGLERAEGASEEIIWKFDVPPNRYDLWCIEGIVLALKVFRGEYVNKVKFIFYTSIKSVVSF